MTEKEQTSGNFVRCNDVDIYVEIRGAGTPLLLVHGWPLDRRIFIRQVEEFSKHFTVIAYDRRGFGRSGGEPDLRRELDDMDCLIDSCTGDTIHLLGMSQGARLAIRYAVTNQQHLRSLVLQGAVIDGIHVDEPENERIPVDEYATLVRQGKIDEFRLRWSQHPMMKEAYTNDTAARVVKDILADYDGRDLQNHDPTQYSFAVDVPAELGKLIIPTLIITGEKETGTRKQHAAELLRLLPNAREVIIPSGGHLCNLTRPESYNNTVMEFLQNY